MLSKKSKYAIRAVLYLSAKTQNGNLRIGGKEVSDSLKMPLAFTVKILQELARGEIISSSKGPGGGFYLGPKNLSKNLMDLLGVFDDDAYFTKCALGLPDCSDDHPCPIHEEFKNGRAKMKDVFENKTIGELGEEVDSKSLYLVI